MANNMRREYEMSIEWKGDWTHQSWISSRPFAIDVVDSDVTTEELSCDDKPG